MGKVNIGRLIQRIEPLLEHGRREEARKKYDEECARLRVLEERRKEEYDKPLPDFPQKIARETRVRLLTYVAKVFNDAARVVLLDYAEKVRRDYWYYGPDDLVDVSFEDRPVQEFSAAIRVAELKPIPGSSRVDRVGTLYIRHESRSDHRFLYLMCHEGIHKRVRYRLEKNLLNNLPILQSLLGESFDARVWSFDATFGELRKSGYQAEPWEREVVHLEIF